MALRMAEYCLAILRKFGRFPIQILVYVGEPPMSMPRALCGPRQLVEWDSLDIRDVDAEPLLASTEVSDNVIAILTRLRNEREAVQRIVARCAELPRGKRDEALEQLFVLSGLRRMVKLVREEATRMPVYIDLEANEVLGPAYRKGEVAMLRRLIAKRFGPLPESVEACLLKLTAPELEDLGERILEAGSLQELFACYPDAVAE
jgi:hypothetical protein